MKSLKDFDYALWTTEENGKKKYFAMVKSTGETTEISLEIMRLLRNEEKKMRRKIEETNERGADLSIDNISDDELTDIWMRDSYDLCNDVQTRIMEEQFIGTLSPLQKKVYVNCVKNRYGVTSTAKTLGITKQAVSSTLIKIRLKAKNFFIDG